MSNPQTDPECLGGKQACARRLNSSRHLIDSLSFRTVGHRDCLCWASSGVRDLSFSLCHMQQRVCSRECSADFFSSTIQVQCNEVTERKKEFMICVGVSKEETRRLAERKTERVSQIPARQQRERTRLSPGFAHACPVAIE